VGGGERVEDRTSERELAVRAAKFLDEDAESFSLSRSEPDEVDPPVLWKERAGRAVCKPGEGKLGLALPDAPAKTEEEPTEAPP